MSGTVADLLVERLIDWRVDTIFGLPGDGVDGLFEALRTHQKQLTFIQVRHEGGLAWEPLRSAMVPRHSSPGHNTVQRQRSM
jgi:Thiamine pyrophosphate enzyme, N-terminal TPP binding domain